MRKLTLITIIVVSYALIHSCNNNGGKDKVKVTIDSLKKDSTSIASTADTAFAIKAASGGIAEVAMGKLALTKSSDAKIKAFANMMITDHGKANTQLINIANAKHITLPSGPDTEHQMKMDSLSKLSGADFNKAYVDAMIAGHQKTLTLMQDEAKNGKETDLRSFAAQTAPIVQMHLDSIMSIKANMK
jgi:putative membrane protein